VEGGESGGMRKSVSLLLRERLVEAFERMKARGKK